MPTSSWHLKIVTHLSATHEEADTRLNLHENDAIQNNYKRVIAICRDNDMLLLLNHRGRKETEVLMVSGTLKHPKCYPVHIIASKLDTNILENILGFHALTGCDITSSFSGIDKKTCWKQYIEAPKLVQSLSKDLNLREVGEFVFRLYGVCVKTEVDIDLIRFSLFSTARKGLGLLPHTKDAFELHWPRVDYQAKIWLDASNAQMNVGTVTDTSGWKLGPKGVDVVWSRLSAVPTACIELRTCGCKTKCSTDVNV